MADIEVVIKIDKQLYENAKNDLLCGAGIMINAIKNGTPLPEHHGRLIDADVVTDGFEDNYELCIAVNDTPTIIPATKTKEPTRTMLNCYKCKHYLEDGCYVCHYEPATKEGAE